MTQDLIASLEAIEAIAARAEQRRSLIICCGTTITAEQVRTVTQALRAYLSPKQERRHDQA